MAKSWGVYGPDNISFPPISARLEDYSIHGAKCSIPLERSGFINPHITHTKRDDGGFDYWFDLDSGEEFRAFGFKPKNQPKFKCLISDINLDACGYGPRTLPNLSFVKLFGKKRVLQSKKYQAVLEVTHIEKANWDIRFKQRPYLDSFSEAMKSIWPKSDNISDESRSMCLFASLFGSGLNEGFLEYESPGIGFNISLESEARTGRKIDLLTKKDIDSVNELIQLSTTGLVKQGTGKFNWTRYLSPKGRILVRDSEKEIDWNMSSKVNDIQKKGIVPKQLYCDISSALSPRQIPIKQKREFYNLLKEAMLYSRLCLQVDYDRVDMMESCRMSTRKILDEFPNSIAFGSFRLAPIVDAITMVSAYDESWIDLILEQPPKKIHGKDIHKNIKLVEEATKDYYLTMEELTEGRNIISEISGAKDEEIPIGSEWGKVYMYVKRKGGKAKDVAVVKYCEDMLGIKEKKAQELIHTMEALGFVSQNNGYIISI